MSQISHCSPDRETHYSKYRSCLTLSELKTLAKKKNATLPEKLKIPDNKMKSYKTILPVLKRTVCKGNDRVDKCLVDSTGYFTDRFRPSQPSTWKMDKNEWLTNLDIERVMNQYDKAYKDYKFLGVWSRDFASKQKNTNTCVSRQLCQYWDELKNGAFKFKRFGIVFNLDKHTGPGTHWVSVFCDLRHKSPKYGICYYDSVGEAPPKEIQEFMKSLKPNDPKFAIVHNTRQQQYGNSECGVFSMMFIILCLQNQKESYQESIKRMFVDKKDEKINNQRDILFRKD